ncbi:MAG TPA: aminotransferase class III-fold pyridoxal phosphate-dependent enzyme [Chitinophagaceae bacterium]|nr:aminotransferase class III-fold pyridoxal phosphate-dependent enzyme [Chitinophagaceae bacterium]
MDLFNVYSLFDITPVKAKGSYLWDKDGEQYLDLYGGHAVISIGHTHPRYVKAITDQLQRIGFYSNSVHNPLQEKLAEKLGKLSGYEDYSLFLCNSGAEANENALKLASFATGRKKIIAFRKAFHGRTSGAVAATDNPKIVSPFNAVHEVEFLPLNDAEALEEAIGEDVAAVIIEGIQGVGGINLVDDGFLQSLRKKCDATGALLIVDEVQSGYGRSGRFFAHQYADVAPDLITIAKGMGNGFPIGGVLISPKIQPWAGELGTTFGGNYLACAAGLAVLEVIETEKLIANAATLGDYLMDKLRGFAPLQHIRGKGLMIGFDVPEELKDLRRELLVHHKIFTGAAGTRTIRLLPSLALSIRQADEFLEAMEEALKLEAVR